MAGAVLLVVLGLLPLGDALNGMRKGIDVYLFLIGMMLIAELARREGLFDWMAALAVEHARGSPQRLFLLVYVVGTIVTILLSNDATAIVLTPAVYAATRAAGAAPLPYLFVCAFIANAASFVLPISNPANLVVYGERMPHLAVWLRQYTLPSIASIVATYVVLRLALRKDLGEEHLERNVPRQKLSHEGKLTAWGIAAIGVVLIGASALDVPLGLPTFLCGAVTATLVLVLSRQSPLPLLKDISWGVLPLVGGLFVMVEALIRTGVDLEVECAAARGRRAVRDKGRVGSRHRHRDRRQYRKQFAGRPRRWLGREQRSPAAGGHRRDPDRRRPRPQSVGDRLARHHPLAGGAAARGHRGQRLALSQSRLARDVSGPDPGAGGAFDLTACDNKALRRHQSVI